jgi:hypothetical protein
MTRIILLVAITSLCLSSLSATAQVRLDMTRITCGDFLQYDSSRQRFVRLWMSGYFSASKNNDVIDLRYLQRNTEKAVTYCMDKKHTSETLLSVIQKTAI